MSFYLTESRKTAGDILTALYDDPATACKAVDRLHAAGVSPSTISLLSAEPDADSVGAAGCIFEAADLEADDRAGLLRLLLKAGIPDYEAALYERRILDGGAVVGVWVNGDLGDVRRILSSFNPVKISLR